MVTAVRYLFTVVNIFHIVSIEFKAAFITALLCQFESKLHHIYIRNVFDAKMVKVEVIKSFATHQ